METQSLKLLSVGLVLLLSGCAGSPDTPERANCGSENPDCETTPKTIPLAIRGCAAIHGAGYVPADRVAATVPQQYRPKSVVGANGLGVPMLAGIQVTIWDCKNGTVATRAFLVQAIVDVDPAHHADKRGDFFLGEMYLDGLPTTWFDRAGLKTANAQIAVEKTEHLSTITVKDANGTILKMDVPSSPPSGMPELEFRGRFHQAPNGTAVWTDVNYRYSTVQRTPSSSPLTAYRGLLLAWSDQSLITFVATRAQVNGDVQLVERESDSDTGSKGPSI